MLPSTSPIPKLPSATKNGLVKLKPKPFPIRRKPEKTETNAKVDANAQTGPLKKIVEILTEESNSSAICAPQHKRGALKSSGRRPSAAQMSGIDLSGDGYLRLMEVLSVYPVSRAAFYEGIASGVYPKSVPLGKRTVAWTRESIRNLVANPPKFLK